MLAFGIDLPFQSACHLVSPGLVANTRLLLHTLFIVTAVLVLKYLDCVGPAM